VVSRIARLLNAGLIEMCHLLATEPARRQAQIQKCKHRRAALSGASSKSGSGVIRGYSNSKRAQQDCTDEREYRENSQYIEP
jgi:hypothetical protein